MHALQADKTALEEQTRAIHEQNLVDQAEFRRRLNQASVELQEVCFPRIPLYLSRLK